MASGFTAVYAVRLFNRVGFGRLDNERADWQSTTWQERLPAMVLTLLVVVGGLWPISLVGWSESSTAALALRSQQIPPSPALALLASAPLTFSQEVPVS